jgi:DNA adenine methylase
MNRPFLKWAGGKYKTLPHLLPHFDKSVEVFVEPFVGAGSVWLNTNYKSYILSDINSDLINVFKCLQMHGQAFIDYCKEFFVDGNTEEKFLLNRSRFNNARDPSERSALFVYLNRHCFNGLCRYNSSGQYNVPYGKYRTMYFPEKEMLFFCEKAKSAAFYCEDFSQTFNRIRDIACVVYTDPPYIATSKTSSFVDYYSGGFDLLKQEQLVNEIKTCKGKVVASNSVTSDYLYNLDNFDEIIEIDSSRSISASKSSRGKIKEIIAIKKGDFL